MGGQDFKKVIVIIILVLMVGGAYLVIYPRINFLNGDDVQKRIIIHQTANDKDPFYITSKGATFGVSIADSDAEREQGLSGTFSLDDDKGMLFFFDKSGFYQMWMRGMLYSIDIIWLDQNFKVVDIKKNLGPDTYPETFVSNSPAQFVLEINAGLSDKYGFMIGDVWHVVNNSSKAI